MSLDVDVNLRVPNVKAPSTDGHASTINNADARFIRRLSLAALPKPGMVLHLETRAGMLLACEVLRAAWSDSNDRFTVYCTYAKRSMSADEHHALVTDPDWVKRPLL
jgi:hypothetical protein